MADSVAKVEVDTNAINKLAKKLTSKNKALRSRTVERLRNLIERSAGVEDGLVSEVHLLRLWKALYYCMSIAEENGCQEELGNHIVGLGSCFKQSEESLLFLAAFLKVGIQEWPLLDCQKVDRFVLLTQKLMRNAVLLLQRNQSVELNKMFINVIEKQPLPSDEVKVNDFVAVVSNILSKELKNQTELSGPEFEQLLQRLSSDRSNCTADTETSELQDKPAAIAENSCASSENSVSCSKTTSKKRKLDSEISDSGTPKRAKICKEEAEKPNDSISNGSLDECIKGASCSTSPAVSTPGRVTEEEVEINIWVPNKKYNGALKGELAKRFAAEDKQCRTVSPKRPNTASLFATPLSDQTAVKKKRVSFALNQNKSQNFEDSLIYTPHKLTFDPDRKPIKGVLKMSPAFAETPLKSKFFRKKKGLKKLKASRFW